MQAIQRNLDALRFSLNSRVTTPSCVCNQKGLTPNSRAFLALHSVVISWEIPHLDEISSNVDESLTSIDQAGSNVVSIWPC